MKRQNGWGLVETLLTLGTITALSAGIYMVFSPANASAQTRAEQQNLGELSQMVENAFGLTGTFEHVNTQRLISERLIPTGMLAGGRLNSSWGGSVVVEPYAVRFLGDAFAVTYTDTSKEVCNRLSAAASGQVHDILVNGTSIFTTSRYSPIAATQECAEGSEVMFVFRPSGINEAYAGDPLDLPPPPASVSPEFDSPITNVVDEAKNVADATETPFNPTNPGSSVAPSLPPLPASPSPNPVNTAPAPPSISGPSTPITVVQACQNGYEDRALSCPAGQYGVWSQRQILACELASNPGVPEAWVPWQAPNDQRVRKGWNTTSNTCAICPPAQNQTLSCPAGQLGNIVQQRSFTCSGAGSWEAWATVSNTCAPACLLPNPSNQTQTESRTASQTLSCPAGQSGSIVQNRQEMRSQSRSASCPAPTGSYVWGSWSSWSNWTATGAWNTASNTCAPICSAPPSSSVGISRALANESRNAGCPVGQTGSHMQTRTVSQNGTRVTSWACPGPTSSVSDSWGGYSYGAWTTTSNTCASPKTYAWELVSHTGDQLIASGPCTTSGTNPSPIPVCSSATEGTTYTRTINRGTCAPVYMPGVSIDTYQCVGK